MTAWTEAGQAPLTMGFPRQEHRSVLLFPSLGDLSNPGIESASAALADKVFTAEPPGKLSRLYTSLSSDRTDKMNSMLQMCNGREFNCLGMCYQLAYLFNARVNYRLFSLLGFS